MCRHRQESLQMNTQVFLPGDPGTDREDESSHFAMSVLEECGQSLLGVLLGPRAIEG